MNSAPRGRHPNKSRIIYPYGIVCDTDDGDTTVSEMMYLCEKVTASVRKRGKIEQIVVHKMVDSAVRGCTIYNIHHSKPFGV